MEDFSSQILSPLDNHEFEDGGDDGLVSESTMSFMSTKVLLEKSYANSHPFYDNYQLSFYENKRAVGGMIQSHISSHIFEDPFAVFLESVNNLKLSYFSFFVNIEFDYKFLFELSLSKYCILFMNKDMKENKTMDKVLLWLHWIFEFT